MTINPARPVAVLTGASAGIGLAAARMLVAKSWQVIGTGRDPARSSAAEAEIAAAARDGGSITMLRADFDSMADVRRLATQITALTPRVDVLLNNAGGVRDSLVSTAEGTEATFAANHLAPFVLTRELLPLLRATAATAPAGSVRVIATSSSAHRIVPGMDWEDLQSFNANHNTAYCRVKLANILFTRELARRVAADGIVAQSMHPGVVASNFASHGDAGMQAHMANAPTVSPDEPAQTLVWMATDAEAGRNPGRYFHKLAEEDPAPPATDDAAAARLWAETEELLEKIGF